MRILVTNDDGVNAEGLATAERIAAALSDDVWTVAPEREQSGAARALSLSDPVRLRQLSERRYAVQGTPTDCVLMGVVEILKDRKPDLVISGVNHGQNIAEDVTFSGTVAGALQGMTLGVPSIALSQARFSRELIRFQTAESHAPGIIEKLLDGGWPDDVVININFPDREPDEVSGVEVTTQGRRDRLDLYADERVDLRGRTYFWLGYQGHRSNAPDGADLRAIYEGRISVTPLHLDLTHDEARAELARRLHDR